MRISLHIVVALLLIALIYREILKGILPPVCGNPLQGMHCLCLPLSFPLAHTLTRILASGFVAVLLPRLYAYVLCFNSCCLPDNSPTRLSRSARGKYRSRLPCLLSFCICLSSISILNLPVFIPYSFPALQDSEAAAENGNRDTGQGLPFWLK